jgi:hypothetical protein
MRNNLYWRNKFVYLILDGGCVGKAGNAKEKTAVKSSSLDYDSLTTALGGLSVSKENAAAAAASTSSSSNSESEPDGVDLGKLLMKFLKFYGEEFDYYARKAVSIAPTPGYGTKTYGYSLT